ncbi:MAG TPA: uroporphyrinogen-III synthase [Polyangiaceae bacterium]|nr:uroporphyrinogen-III synthase [Polyangiaceae bacterium]
MTDSLGGARVALLEARMESELASLVRRHGGEPLCVPALREVERECSDESAAAIDAAARPGALVVLATGVGLARWLAVAESLARRDALRTALASATVVCRGPKPVAVLKREGLTAHVRAEPPHTTSELLAALDAIDVTGRDAVFVHDGGASRTVPDALRGRGARVAEVQPYGWALPADLQPLRDLCGAVAQGRVDAVAFTTQIQAKHLFDVAERAGLRDAVANAMRGRVLVAAVGPTCARALEELGVPPHVVPAQGKMGAMVVALAEAMTTKGQGR